MWVFNTYDYSYNFIDDNRVKYSLRIKVDFQTFLLYIAFNEQSKNNYHDQYQN